MSEIVPNNFESVYANIKNILNEARKTVFRSVNFVMVQAYWQIGRLIVEEEQQGKERAEYGKYLIKELSEKLVLEFGKGFDESNLRNMRLFYLNFPIRDALRHELTWTHYRLLLRVENPDGRDFYIIEIVQNNWSTRELEREIHSLLYERITLTRCSSFFNLYNQDLIHRLHRFHR
ncbi:MAG: DUF1016 N-terminal domain-containing protein [Nitrospirota bacterium]